MKPYKDWSPTPFDTARLSLPDQQEWLVSRISRTRDSGCLDRSNFDQAVEALAGEPGDTEEDTDTWQVHRFGHWGPGWVEIILAKPDTRAAEILAELEERLDDYPVLDEEALSALEEETASETWERMSVRDRAELIRDLCDRRQINNVSIFAARHPYRPEGIGLEEVNPDAR